MEVHPDYWKPHTQHYEREGKPRTIVKAPFNYDPRGHCLEFVMRGNSRDLEVFTQKDQEWIFDLKKFLPYPVPVVWSGNWCVIRDWRSGRVIAITVGAFEDAIDGLLSFLHEVAHVIIGHDENECTLRQERRAWILAFQMARKVCSCNEISLTEYISMRKILLRVGQYIRSHQS
jgi:hypothetical protein